MLTISRALGASQAESYHRSEFTSPEQSYYTKGNVLGEWQGRLADEWGLVWPRSTIHRASAGGS